MANFCFFLSAELTRRDKILTWYLFGYDARIAFSLQFSVANIQPDLIEHQQNAPPPQFHFDRGSYECLTLVLIQRPALLHVF